MGLLSFLQRFTRTPAEPAPAPDAVSAARIRARRRLIGASVLLAAGIVGFPLLFETQPRPVPADIAIELPQRDSRHTPAAPAPTPMASAPGAVLSDARSDLPAAVDPATVAVAQSPAGDAASPHEISERADEQGQERAAPAAAPPRPPAASLPAAASRPAAAKPAKAASTTTAAALSTSNSTGTSTSTESARARALLDGQADAASAPAARLVVQVGAFTDADKLREARSKVEKLGFKTYTQVVAVEGGKRTRVRIGPFASRAEADKAALRLKQAGLAAAILTL